MRPVKGEAAFTVKERIVLHLGGQRTAKDIDVPNSLTQEGISLGTGIMRGNVARALKEMGRARLVELRRARPVGRTHIANCYRLGRAGEAELEKLILRAGKLDVKILTPGGERVVALSEIPAYVPSGCTISELAGAVRFHELDLERFEKGRVKRGMGGYAMRGVPETGAFFGRCPETAKASEWLYIRKAKMLMVTGIAGIGKTAFASKMAMSWSAKSHICWIPLRRWTAAKQVASDIGEFLSALGRHRAASSLTAGDWDARAFGRALAEDVRKLRLVIVLDDIHVARSDIADLVSILLDVARGEQGLKLVAAGRKCPRFHDGRDVLEGTVSEIRLGFLDVESSRKILATRHIVTGRLIKLCGGHPLLLRLAPAEPASADKSLENYLRAEVFSGLAERDWRAMAMLCLSREPVSMDALVGPLGVGRARLDRLVERGLVVAVSPTALGVHDILSDYVRSRLADPERKRAHQRLGRHYAASVGPVSGLEAIYHLCKAGENEEARALFGRLAAELVAKGFVRGLDEAADAMCGGEVDRDPKFLTTIGKVYGHVGRWKEAAMKIGLAISLAREARTPIAECDALCTLGELCLRRGMKTEARNALNQAIKLAVRIKDKEAEARGRYFMGSLLETEDTERADEEFDVAKVLAESCGSTSLLALAFYGKGRVEEARGHIGRAHYYKARALKLLESGDEKTTMLKLLISLGKNSFALHDVPRSVDYYNRAIVLAKETGNLPLEGMALANLGGVLIRKPDLTSAEQALTKARDILVDMGDRRALVAVHNNLSMMYYRRGQYAEARDIAMVNVRLAENIAQPRALAIALTFLGMACKACNYDEEARSVFERALVIAVELGDKQMRKEISKEFFGPRPCA